MARKAKTKDEAESPSATTLEGLNDEQMQALAFQHKTTYEKLLAAKKKADADLRNECKLIKAELGADGLDTIKDMIACDTEEGEAKLRATVERQIRVARWMGLPVGLQGSLFDDIDRTPAAEKARGEGKRAGMEAKPRKPPYDPSTEQYREWMAGYDEGQGHNAQKFVDGAKPKHGGVAARAAAEAGEAHIKAQLGSAKPTFAEAH